MATEEKLQLAKQVSLDLKHLSVGIFEHTDRALKYLTAQTSGDITLTDEQKTAFITKYNTIKQQMVSKFQELP